MPFVTVKNHSRAPLPFESTAGRVWIGGGDEKRFEVSSVAQFKDIPHIEVSEEASGTAKSTPSASTKERAASSGVG